MRTLIGFSTLRCTAPSFQGNKVKAAGEQTSIFFAHWLAGQRTTSTASSPRCGFDVVLLFFFGLSRKAHNFEVSVLMVRCTTSWSPALRCGWDVV